MHLRETGFEYYSKNRSNCFFIRISETLNKYKVQDELGPISLAEFENIKEELKSIQKKKQDLKVVSRFLYDVFYFIAKYCCWIVMCFCFHLSICYLFAQNSSHFLVFDE